MVHYRIERVTLSYWKIKARGLFRYHDFDGVYYNTASEALKALDKAIHGVGCIIKVIW